MITARLMRTIEQQRNSDKFECHLPAVVARYCRPPSTLTFAHDGEP
jgi:hypothetical protein